MSSFVDAQRAFIKRRPSLWHLSHSASLGTSHLQVFLGFDTHPLGWPRHVSGISSKDWLLRWEIYMRMTNRNTARNWARMAMNLGLLLTDDKILGDMAERLTDRADDVSDAARRTYDDAADRLEGARTALRGESDWVAPILSFVGGIAVGAGLGILFAPKSGEMTRASLRDIANEAKNTVSYMAKHVDSTESMPATGTDGN
jgi:YtxH-like protein